jgi:ribosome recycling factor
VPTAYEQGWQLHTKTLPGFHRNFSQNPILYKKKAKKDEAPAAKQVEAVEEDESKHPKPNPEQPLDFSDVLSRWAAIDEFHNDIVKKMRSGGRFNPDAIGNVPVQPDKKSPETFALHELAQVVPRSGRTISLLVHEKEYIKPIISAIQASPDFNQQPQRSEDNELELILKVELEKKEEMVKRLKESCQAWRLKIRQAKSKRDKVTDKWRKSKAVLVDVAKKADTDLQKLQDKKMTEIDKIEEQAQRQLANRSE